LNNRFPANLSELVESLLGIKRREFGAKLFEERRPQKAINDDVAERRVPLEIPAQFPGLIDHLRMDEA
jgi:hypothetical protein